MKKLKLHPRTIRSLLLLSMALIIFLVFVLRLIQLQIFQHNQWAVRSQHNHATKRVLEMKRGSILDRNGVELAISVDTYNVCIYTRELKSISDTATALASVLPMSREEIIARIGDRSGYFSIYKDLEPNLAMKLDKLDLPGVVLESNYRRYYPQKTLASNIIGFTGTDKHGLEGLEYLYENTLRGYPGLAVQESISLSDTGPAKMRVITPPMGGSNINLTIDAFIQHTLETELDAIVKTYDPIDATAIAMDPATGEILGMACIPDYDLNNFSVSKPEQRRNRPVTDSFEPGSCMKIFAMAAAIESGKADHGTRFYCRGYAELEGRRIKCHGAHGLVDMEEAIAESCNAAMAQVSQMIDHETLYRTYKLLGFGDLTGIEVPGEITGKLNPPSKWSGFSAASLCFGQELTTTAIQLVTAYSAIANGGILLKPHIIKRISSPDNDIIQNFNRTEVRKALSPETAKWLRKMLLGVVEGGTGKLAWLEDYTIGGKTSTAQKANPKGGYYNDKVVTSFIGMAPALNPRLVLYVGVNEPKGDEKTLYGGKVAAPAFARIMDRVLKYLKVPPDRTTSLAARKEQLQRISSNETQEIVKLPNKLNGVADLQTAKVDPSGLTPDLHGISMKRAIKTLNALGLKGIFEGNGLVISQSPKPGTPIPESKIILLNLSPDFGK
ncbi:MAG: stage V sporulation protein D [Candidatus Rifleibacteriota bacterium]